MSQDTERPKVPEFTDGALQLALRHPSDTIKMLAFDLIAKNAEVQASRKLVADLRGLVDDYHLVSSALLADTLDEAGL